MFGAISYFFNQTFDYYTKSISAEGDITAVLELNNVKCRFNEGTAIVNDSRGEDKQYDLVIQTNSTNELEKGNIVSVLDKFYLVDDVRVTRNFSGIKVLQSLMLKKTNNIIIAP
jgi:hypothetical protein